MPIRQGNTGTACSVCTAVEKCTLLLAGLCTLLIIFVLVNFFVSQSLLRIKMKTLEETVADSVKTRKALDVERKKADKQMLNQSFEVHKMLRSGTVPGECENQPLDVH